MQYHVRFFNPSTESAGHLSEEMVAGPFSEFIQITYTELRSGPEGEAIAELNTVGEHAGCWNYNNQWFSDIVIDATDADELANDPAYGKREREVRLHYEDGTARTVHVESVSDEEAEFIALTDEPLGTTASAYVMQPGYTTVQDWEYAEEIAPDDWETVDIGFDTTAEAVAAAQEYANISKHRVSVTTSIAFITTADGGVQDRTFAPGNPDPIILNPKES